MACATIAHSAAESSFCATTVANKCFDLCRAKRLVLPGFPDFQKTVGELKTATAPPQPEYSVTVGLGDALIIKEALIDQWMGKPDYKSEMEKLLKQHNDKYNQRGLKRGSEVSGGSQSDRPSKRICVEGDPLGIDEFETKYSERCGNFGSKKNTKYKRPLPPCLSPLTPRGLIFLRGIGL